MKDWFAEHPYITLLPHPPRLPDLNPTEHMWAAMVKRMPVQQPRTHAAVIASALEVWEQLRRAPGRNYTETLVTSMPSRLNAVLAAGGGYTKY